MNNIETVTRELLERELTSERLYLGIEACIKKSIETDRESGFHLAKEIFTERIMYPEHIILGDRYQLSERASLLYALAEYTRVTGKDVRAPWDPEFSRFCDERELRRIPYPHIEEEFRFNLDFPETNYNFFGIHTHLLKGNVNWCDLLTPSGEEGDFSNLEYNKHPTFKDPNARVLLRPINGIVLADKKNSVQPFLLYQKKDFSDLSASQLREAEKEAEEYLRFQTVPIFERFRRKFPRASFHNFGFGFVDLAKKRLRLGLDFRIENFAYSSETVSEEEWERLKQQNLGGENED